MALQGEAKREYHREWLRQRRQEWIDSKGGRCVRCGSTSSIEIDHIDPSDKELQIGKIWSRTEDVREAELEKCQLLCHACHTAKTNLDRGFLGVTHGTTTGYKHHKCRCSDCKAANTIAVQRQRSRKAVSATTGR